MTTVKRPKDKAVLSKQDIVARRKALKEKKMGSSNTGRRAIVGVFIFAASVLSFLSIATFDAHDRVGPGFRNAIGPVGHAIGEAFRGLLGIVALVVPMVGFYAAGVLFVGDRERKRWPQLVSFVLFLVSGAILAQLLFREDASWAHAPGGLIGRELGGVLTALFSTVGTVVLVSAIAATAAIVGTQYAFLRFCTWAFEKSLVAFEAAKAWALTAWAEQQKRLEERKLEAEKAKAEEEAFLSQLEDEEAELAELEAAAQEAEAAAEEAERLQKNQEEARARAIAEKEKLRLERERLAVEREAARLAKEALKSARLTEKETRAKSVAALTPGLLDEAKTVAPAQAQPLHGDPAWAMAFTPLAAAQPPPPPPVSMPPEPAEIVSSPPVAAATRRVPTIVEPPAAPPPLPVTLPPLPASELAALSGQPAPAAMPAPEALAPAGAGALAIGSQASALTAAGASALARMPVIVEPKAPPKPTKVENKKQFEFSDGRTGFDLPPLDMLDMKKNEKKALDKEAFLVTADRLTSKLRDFGIEGEVVEIRPGPVVTMYEFKPAPGVKISRIASLSDDLAMAMEAMRVRIVAPIPGKGVVGIEVPNKEREMVFLKEIAEQDAFQKSPSRLTMCLGKDIEGMPYILDLAKAPHLLMAGTTGSGKSVSVNAMIMSILLKSTPEEVRFIMVDPKMLELSIYEGIPHLLLPVVTDPRKAAVALQWAVDEMTRRYKLLSEAGVRNITGYNTLVETEAKKKAAAKSTVEAKATVIKPEKKPAPVVEPKPARPAPVAEAKPAEPAPEPVVAAAPAEPPKKKKRKLLIVDVADGQEPPSSETPVAPEAAAAPALDLGVAAPTEPSQEIREAVASPELEQAVEAAKTEAEIRVEEAAVAQADESAPSEQEAAALAEAAAEPHGDASPETEERQKLPYIVVIIDELADLMMVASKEVETSIARLAQMARAAGIHLMVATQRPSTDVVTGVIKANFPTRISFMLRSKPDSMTIIGTVGAEALLGMGDMLIMPPTSAHLQRVHGCFVAENEIKKVVDHLKAQGKPVYDESILKPREEENEGGDEGEDELSDELYDQAIAIVSEMKNVSISMLQRKMRIGYNRAARMIERMERDGVVGPADGAKPREVLVRGVGQMPGAGAMM
jgi:S-DNA-T family DNA segregation ATPase FtsK/SpoIIIE